MTIQVTSELDFNDLMSQCWSGAVDTLNRIYDNNKEARFMDLLNERFACMSPTLTEVNDYLWFQSDEIFEYLGISEDDEEEGEDDEDEYDEEEGEDDEDEYDEDEYDEDDEDDEEEGEE